MSIALKREEAAMILTLNTVIGAVAYNSYSSDPDFSPRNIDAVMEKVREYLKQHFEQPSWCKQIWYKEIDEREAENFVHDMIFSIPEFKEWNLSHLRFYDGTIYSACIYDSKIDLDIFSKKVYMTIFKNQD